MAHHPSDHHHLPPADPHAGDHPGHDHAEHGHGHGDGHGHGHGHDHGHAHDHGLGFGHAHAVSGSARALGWALGLNAAFLAVEVGVGWWSGSLALLSDAAHMVSDVGALVLALAAARLARRPANRFMTYGLVRAEVLGAFLNGLALLIVCGLIVRESVARMAAGPPEVPGAPVLVVGVVGLVINLASAAVLHRADHGDLNVRGAMLHMLGDALGSVAAIVAAVLLLFGFTLADPVASVLVAALVAFGAVFLVRDAGRVLLELPPPGFDVGGVWTALRAVDGVVDVHDLHAWSLDGRTPLVSVHLVVDADAAPEHVSARARTLLGGTFGVHHATLQLERPDHGEPCAVRCGDA